MIYQSLSINKAIDKKQKNKVQTSIVFCTIVQSIIYGNASAAYDKFWETVKSELSLVIIFQKLSGQ